VAPSWRVAAVLLMVAWTVAMFTVPGTGPKALFALAIVAMAWFVRRPDRPRAHTPEVEPAPRPAERRTVTWVEPEVWPHRPSPN
jgi:MYXO-CTERM domain-containing protein